MILTDLELTDMRNYASLVFHPSPGINMLLGDNAQGKSNLLEAVAMLGIGKSFRTIREAEIIREGCTFAVIVGKATASIGTVRLACRVSAPAHAVRKEYTINGEPVKHASFLGHARVVTFIPADLRLIDGAPALRRSFLNVALAQENPLYRHALAHYGRVTTQKNALLRGGISADPVLLDAYDAQMAEFGTTLMIERERYIAEIARTASVAALCVDQGKTGLLNVAYRPNISYETATREGIRNAFLEQLSMRRSHERYRAQALVGPHRDDMLMTLGEKSIAVFGSQGQRRTAVLSLKIAEYTVMRERTGEAPLLLLDDVLSELDEHRKQGFLESLGTVKQAFITGTAEPMLDVPSACYRIDAAMLTRIR
jgi:DNA replication and repair protein RecF